MTQIDAILGLIAFCFITTVTPGPNNMMLLSSGMRFGFARTLPHILGIVLGVAVMVGAVGLGLAGLFIAHPGMKRVLMVVSFAWILWLAWKLATAPAQLKADATSDAATDRPMTLLGAAMFQWVNPKAWAMVLGALGSWGSTVGTIAVMLAFALTGFPAIAAWAAVGQSLRRFLAQPARLRVFNGVMAALLVASMLPVLWA